MDQHIGPPLPLSSLRLLVSPVGLVSGAIWHTVQRRVVSDYGKVEEFVSLVTDVVPELLTVEQKTQLLLGLRAQTDPSYDEALVTVIWQFLSRLEKLLPLQTIHQAAFMLADIPSALEECLQSVSCRSELQTLLGYRKERLDVGVDGNDSPLDGADVTPAVSVCLGDDVKVEEGNRSQVEGPQANAAVAVSEEMESTQEESEAEEGTGRRESTDVLRKDCRVLLKRLDDNDNNPSVQRILVRPNRGLKMKRILLQEKNTKRKLLFKRILPRPQTLALEPTMAQSVPSGTTVPCPSISYTIACDDDSEDSVDSCDDPSYTAPIGSSCEDESLSDCSDKQLGMASYRDGKGVTLKKRDTAKRTSARFSGLCLICNKHVQTDLKKHMEAHFPDGVFSCPRCCKVSKSISALRMHFKRICFDEVAEGRLKCDDCDRSFRNRLLFNSHKLAHDPLYCGVCRKVLRDSETLARHKASHMPFQCTLCETNFVILKHLSRHYENVHQLSKPYTCHHCPKVFSQLRFFIRHEWKHTGQLPFQCAQCSMKFKQDSDLVTHLRVHTREKPYPCPDCGRGFAWPSNLRRHMARLNCEFRKVRRFPPSQRKREAAQQKKGQKMSDGPCKNCGTVSHSSELCPQILLPANGSNPPLAGEMTAIDGAHVGVDDANCVGVLQDSSSVPLVGGSSKDDDTLLDDPNDLEDSLVTLGEPDTPQRRRAAANKGLYSGLRRQCFICLKYVQRNVKDHMKIHFPDDVLTCPRCDTVFKSMPALRLHFKRVCIEQLQIEPSDAKVGEALFKCEDCDKSFRYKLTFDGHKRTHNPLYCGVCRRVLRDAETLARHKASHTPFQCTLCEANFGVFKHLSRHYENVHQLSKPYTCHHCPKVFSHLRFFIRHEWKHTGQFPLQCSQCSMRFKQDADLVTHLRVHTQEKPYLCTDCGRTFSCNSNLRRHVYVRHSEFRDSRRFACPLCDRTFKEKGALIKHDERKHQKIQRKARHPCTYCGKMFSRAAMARHTLIHTGEKPMKCHVAECDRRFRSSSEVKNHVLRHHSADRPFECGTCGKGFVRASILSDHMKIHSGERAHVCLVCGKAFLKVYGLNRHVQLMHTPK